MVLLQVPKFDSEDGSLDGVEFADTAIMKTLEDMRKLLAQENTELLPAATENLPTAEQ